LELARYPLFGKTFEQKDGSSDVGPKSPEKLMVLLSHKAIMVRARDGRFDWGLCYGHSYTPSSSELVIPIREDDLYEYVDNYGHDDADFLMMRGRARRYKRDGRWASWRITAVYPEPLSSTASALDKNPVKPND
jgi:hypothetical protein